MADILTAGEVHVLNFEATGVTDRYPWTVENDCFLVGVGSTVGAFLSLDPQRSRTSIITPTTQQMSRFLLAITSTTSGMYSMPAPVELSQGEIIYISCTGAGQVCLYLMNVAEK